MLHRKGMARVALALSLLVGLATAASASAAPVEGPAGEAFYTIPGTLPEGGAGTLIQYRPTTVNLGVTLPSVKAYDVMYKSTSQTNEPSVDTGMVIEPTAAWTGSGSRPVVDVAEGTQGLGHQCAPSIQITGGTEYDGASIVGALKKNYAVDVTDYEGYTNGAVPSYIAGRAEGHAVLDIAKAAPQLPGTSISSGAPVVIWGYSQGGQAAGWAGQLISSYAPEVHFDGVAAGGVPGNLQALAEFGEGSSSSAFGLDGVIGIAYAYQSLANPEAELASLLNAEGLAIANKLKTECAIQSLAEVKNKTFQSLSKTGETYPEVQAHNPVVASIVAQQKLGNTAVPVPVYHYHGLIDEFVPVKQDAELHEAWCSLGVKDDFNLYPGEHLLTDPTSVPEVMKWIEERLEGKAAPSTCGQHSSATELPAGARLTPETGDLIVQIPNWVVTGSVTDKKLGIALKIPAGATFSAEGDISSGTVSATLFTPPINETVTLFGLLPVTIKGALEQAGPITGKFGLANNGNLLIEATGGANLITKSLSIAFFTINLNCHTSTPIQLPLSLNESANALYTGSVSVNDSVTIPSFTGCGIFGPVTTALLSGPENTVAFNAAPAPPTSW
jgi:hypothetical protein